VAFLIDYYRPFEVGGAERSAAALARALHDAGARVVVLTPNYGTLRQELDAGVEIVRLPFPQRLEPGQLARRRWSGNVLLQIFYGAIAAALTRRRKIRQLHVQNSPMIIAGAIASVLSRRPLIVTVRDLAYIAPSRRRVADEARPAGLKHRVDAWYGHLEHRLRLLALRRASRIVFVSRGLQSVYASENPGWLGARSQVVYNIGPAPAERDADRAQSNRVLFVGKLSTGKGIHVLYDTIRIVARQRPAVVFDLVGEPGVGWTAPPADIAAQVRLHGRLPEGAVADLMSQATVLVSPSVWPEPLSRVLLEAMSRAVPIVATAVGGTTEAVDAAAAEIVPPGDSAALANAVIQLLADPGRRRSLVERASARYRDLFTAERIVPQMLHVYRSAV
jgi:glycosyltransferase involved in cell wall biosynthesis